MTSSAHLSPHEQKQLRLVENNLDMSFALLQADYDVPDDKRVLI